MQEQNNQAFQSPQSEEDSIDIMLILYKIVGHWPYFVVSAVIALGLAFFVTKRTAPSYKNSASIIIEQQEESGMPSLDGMDMFAGMDILGKNRIPLFNQVGKMQSYDLARAVVEKMNLQFSYFVEGTFRNGLLYPGSPFVVEEIEGETKHYMAGAPIKVWLLPNGHLQVECETTYTITGTDKKVKVDFSKEVAFNEEININDFKFRIKRNISEYSIPFGQNEKYIFKLNNYDYLAKHYQKAITIDYSDDESSIITIGLEGQNIRLNCDYINTLASIQIERDLDSKRLKANSMVEFIDNQLTNLVDSLIQTGDSYRNFRVNQNVINLEAESQLLIEKYESMQTEISQQKLQLDYLNYTLKYIEEQLSFSDIVMPSMMGIDNQVLSSLVLKLSQLYEEKEVLSLSASDKNPGIIKLNVSIQNTETALLENIQNLKNAGEVQMKEYKQQMADVKEKLLKIPTTENQAIEMKRIFDLNSNMYTFLLERREEARITKASIIPRISFVDMANPRFYEQTGPKTKINLAIGLILGLIFPAVIIFAADFINQKIRTPEELERHTSIPLITQIPYNKYDTELPVYKYQKSVLSESYRALRTQLNFMLDGKDKKGIMVCSLNAGEGKSFTASNLASVYALNKKKVLLVGCDLRKARLHKIFGLEEANRKSGLSLYLSGQSKFEDIISPSRVPNLDVVISGPVPPNPSELLNSEHMDKFIEIAKEKYDYVILDTPPIMLISDAIHLNKYVDIDVYVTRQGVTTQSSLKFLNSLKGKGLLKHPQLILNAVDIKKAGYGRYGMGNYRYGSGGYGYGYGYGYGQYAKSGYYMDDEHVSST